jgi:hypothetical protein
MVVSKDLTRQLLKGGGRKKKTSAMRQQYLSLYWMILSLWTMMQMTRMIAIRHSQICIMCHHSSLSVRTIGLGRDVTASR